MKIEAGKFYRCRNGGEARIYATDDGVHGAILNDGRWRIAHWYAGGRALWGEDSPNDLISEWSDNEPSKEQLAAAYAVFDDLPDPVTSEAMCLAIARAVLNAPKGE